MFLEKILSKAVQEERPGPRMVQVPMRHAGVVVDHDKALQSSAVYACIRVIAEDIASLPWHVFARRQTGGRDRVASSPVESVLDRRANPNISAFAFRETMIAWALTWGNAYAEIERDNAGRIVALWPIAPDRVEVSRDAYGELVYEISNTRQANTYLDARDIYHLHGLGFDGTVGYSVISLAARSIGLSISLEEFGAQFFGNGATLGGVIKIPADSRLGDDAKKNIKDTFNQKHQGVKRSHNIEVLDAGMEYQEIGIEPDKGQFTESKQHQVEEICRWFRVSPQKIAHLLRMTFNNVEQLSIDHVQDALIPWIRRLEQEADYKLFGKRNLIQYTKINVNGLLRGDTASRTSFYREMWNLGVLSPNEIRDLEEMNPIENGDKRFVQLNMTTLDKAGEEQAVEPPEESQQQDSNLQNLLIPFMKIEEARIIDLAMRYNDRTELAEKISGFYGRHKSKLVSELQNVIEPEILTLYVANHKDEVRGLALKYLDGVEIPSSEERAKNDAIWLESLIKNQCRDDIEEQNNARDKSKR